MIQRAYTQTERDEIARQIRKFAESETYEHCTSGLKKNKRITVHDVKMTRRDRQFLNCMAAMIEHNVEPPT